MSTYIRDVHNVVPTATGINYTSVIAGEYRVKAEKAACVLYSASYPFAGINVLDTNLLFIYLQPNPTPGLLTVNRIFPSQKWHSLEVVNLQGSILFPPKNISGLRSVQVDVTKLPAGLYFLRLTNEDGRKKSYRFIKE